MISNLRIVEILDPCLELKNNNRLFTTLEGENPGGSIKDHMVRGEIMDLLKRNILKKGDRISEVSSGSTANSLAHYCSLFGLKCVLFVPDTAPWQFLVELQKKGAEVHTAKVDSIYTIYDSYSLEHSNVYRFNQLYDETKRRHYHKMGQQILNALEPVNAIIGGIGTGHSLFGTAQGLGKPRIISAEPDPSYKISGVRNIEHERYGAQDKCQHHDLNHRVIVPKSQILASKTILTSEGAVEIPPSFQLVLTGLKIYLQDQAHLRVFALGASLKHPDPSAIKLSETG